MIVKRGRALVEARGMLILLSDGDDLVIAAVAGQVASEHIGTRIPVAESAGGAVLRSRTPERITDAATRLGLALAEIIDAKNGLLVPLVFHGRVMGVLEAFDSLGDSLEFSAEDERIMEAFAASAATAVATAQNVAEQTLQRSIDASDRERARWARELHDETLQELSALKITLSGVRRAVDVDALNDGIETALQYSEHAISGLRDIISDFRPAALDALGSQAALETLVDRVRTRSDLEVELNADLAFESGRAATRHAPSVELGIYRITQEAIANTLKHAQATRAIITLVEGDETLSLSIEDDGCGFDPDDSSRAGFGLIGIRERVELLGETISITSRPGAGTRVDTVVPVARRPAEVGDATTAALEAS